MTKDECINNKDWKQLAKISSEEARVKRIQEFNKKEHEFYVYVVTKARGSKIIH